MAHRAFRTSAPNVTQSIRRKNMGVNHRKTKRPLKPFRQFLPESFRGTRHRRASANALNEVIEESDDVAITDAAMVMIGSELSVSERKALSDGFANDLKEMRDRGGLIIAIAVASE
jgi:hypothetical protein